MLVGNSGSSVFCQQAGNGDGASLRGRPLPINSSPLIWASPCEVIAASRRRALRG